MEGNRVATTLSIDKDVKKKFKLECLRNGNEMSKVIEIFMQSYTSASIELNNKYKS